MTPNAEIKPQDVRSSPDLSGLEYPPGWERQGTFIKENISQMSTQDLMRISEEIEMELRKRKP
jgi:hypothetical protein